MVSRSNTSDPEFDTLDPMIASPRTYTGVGRNHTGRMRAKDETAPERAAGIWGNDGGFNAEAVRHGLDTSEQQILADVLSPNQQD